MTGVSGTVPRPMSGGAAATGAATVRATAASAAGVWWRKTSRAVSTIPSARARLTSWIETMLSPPSAKKPSSGPARSSPSSCANSSQRHRSVELAGSRPPAAAAPWFAGSRPPPVAEPCSAAAAAGEAGAGSALRSSLPLGVSGSASSATTAAGTICSGRLRAACSRSGSVAGAGAPPRPQT